ncbi:MAG TPA: glycoside hydrolase family 2 TIM barrel-domain containing protein [Candidatus Methylacidiphilales bacterium]
MASISLSPGSWKLSGWTPDAWRVVVSMESNSRRAPEVAPVPCAVPGSVQLALREAGLLPDWNVGLNSRLCEWVENRHWIFETSLPPLSPGSRARLRFEGLDGACEVWLGKRKLGAAANAFIPHVFPFEVPESGAPGTLRVIFLDQPRWLGQTGYTSRIRDWKPRFNYTWDWIPRLVQIGIWGAVHLETGEDSPLEAIGFTTSFDWKAGRGGVKLTRPQPHGEAIALRLTEGGRTVASASWPAGAADFVWSDLPVEGWWPNGAGEAKLYTLEAAASGFTRTVRVGFKHVHWESAAGAPPQADPWICRVNGTPVFLQGVNWTPIRPNFADLRREDYEQRLGTYKEMGVNCVRIWGGGFPEYDWLYDLCDEAGILLWQDFPFSSSGLDNWPPEDPALIEEAQVVCRSYVERLRGHPSLLLWCGGNELQGAPDGNPIGVGKPVGMCHPLIAAMARIAQEADPDRRFVAASSSGPRFMAFYDDFGKGVHWDVHGPWKLDDVGVTPWQKYWEEEDSLFRSELGNAGAQPADLMRAFLGDQDFLPPSLDNPFWQRFGWWFEIDEFVREHGDRPWAIEDYVAWSQRRQADKLGFVAASVKDRFPRCGGLLVWMGHDAFPCSVNTSILDFLGRPKPAALALREVFLRPVTDSPR